MIKIKKYIIFFIVLLNIIISCNNGNLDNYSNILMDDLKKKNLQEYEVMKKIYEAQKKLNYKGLEEGYIELTKYNKIGYLYIAEIYQNIHFEEEKAEEKYKIAYEKGNKEAAIALAMIERKKENYEKAIEWYKKGLDKNRVESYRGLIDTLNILGKYDEVKKYAIEAAKLNDAQSMIYLFEMYESEKNEKKSKYWKDKLLNTKEIYGYNEEIEKILKNSVSENKYEKLLYNLYIKARYYMNKKEYQTAKSIYLEMEELNPRGKLETANFYCYFENEIEKCLEKYEDAYEEGVKEAAIYLGKINEEKNRIKTAIKWYTIAANNGNTESQIRLAKILEKKGKKKEAFELYKRAAEGKNYEGIDVLLKYYYQNKNKEEIKKWVNIVQNSTGLKNYTTIDAEVIKLYAEYVEN